MTIIIEPLPDGTQNLPRHTKTVLLDEVQDGRVSQSRTRYETKRVLHAVAHYRTRPRVHGRDRSRPRVLRIGERNGRRHALL
jgi:hypothetical protein